MKNFYRWRVKLENWQNLYLIVIAEMMIKKLPINKQNSAKVQREISCHDKFIFEFTQWTTAEN